MVLREEMYFEPRTISPGGSIRWFGATYSADPMLYHAEQTVYIRDNGKMLFIYELKSDKFIRKADLSSNRILQDCPYNPCYHAILLSHSAFYGLVTITLRWLH